MEQSAFGRVISVLLAPVKTFESISERPTWLAPLILLMITGAIAAGLVTQKMDFADVIQTRIEQQGQDVPEEQIEQIVSLMERFGWVFGLLGAVIFQPLGYLIVALVLFLAFKMAGEIDFQRAFSVTLHSMMPFVILTLLTIGLIFGRESIDAQMLQTQGLVLSNLGFLASTESPPALAALLRSFDFFTLWVLVLLTLGFSTVAKVKTVNSAVIVFGSWVAWVVVKVGWAAVTAMFGG